MNNIIRTFCSIKHFIFKGFQDLVFADDENVEARLAYCSEWNTYLKVFSEIFDIDIDVKDTLLGLDRVNFISSFLKIYLEDDKIGEILLERFGHELFFFYYLLNNSLALSYTLSFIELIEEDLSCLEQDYVNSEYNYAKDYLRIFCKNLSAGDYIKLKYLNKTELILLDEIVLLLKNDSPVEEISKKFNDYIGEILVNQLEIDINLKISKQLTNALDECNPGKRNWKEYEDITFDILKFLFLPQFKYLFEQVRTEDGHQIRDIVMPNYQENGFFKDVKNEFESKNIVIEAKNSALKELNKDSLNQLRIYLHKKTIGRFGMLLIRKTPNSSILKAQKLAYEESNILILVIDDEKFKKLILCKALFGSCEHYLYKLKTDFEIDY